MQETKVKRYIINELFKKCQRFNEFSSNKAPKASFEYIIKYKYNLIILN